MNLMLILLTACGPSVPGTGRPVAAPTAHPDCTAAEQLWAADTDTSFTNMQWTADGTLLHPGGGRGLTVELGQVSFDQTFGDHTTAPSPDGALYASIENNAVHLRDPHTFAVIDTLETPDAIFYLEWARSGDRLVGLSRNGALYVWDMVDRSLSDTWPIGELDNGVELYIDDAASIALITNNTRSPRTYDLQTGELLVTFEDHLDGVWGGGLSPDGSQAVTGDTIGSAWRWDPRTGEVLGGYERLDDRIRTAAFMDHGRAYMVGGTNGYLAAFRTSDDREIFSTSSAQELWLIRPNPDDWTFATAEYPHDRSLPARVKLWCMGPI